MHSTLTSQNPAVHGMDGNGSHDSQTHLAAPDVPGLELPSDLTISDSDKG